jgi:hypothetical protein
VRDLCFLSFDVDFCYRLETRILSLAVLYFVKETK